MPIIEIKVLAGREQEVKERLMRNVTRAVCDTLGVLPEQVRVLLYEIPPAHWAVGGQSKSASSIQSKE